MLLIRRVAKEYYFLFVVSPDIGHAPDQVLRCREQLLGRFDSGLPGAGEGLTVPDMLVDDAHLRS